MNIRRAFPVFPNLFTLANIFCGFFALTLCAGSPAQEQLYEAALAICFGFFFDLFDGRVARLTKTQSSLGLQLDSLADAVTFGAAPALLVYKWGLTKFGMWGIFIAFLFLAAGVLRLARFNVLTETHAARSATSATSTQRQHRSDKHYFIGLSIPAAAGVIISLVVVHYHVGGEYVSYGQGAIATLVVILSYLMISRVRFRSFKHLRPTKRTLGILFLLVCASLVISVRLSAAFIFVFLMSAYVALGLAEEIYRFVVERRRQAGREGDGQGSSAAAGEEEELDDDEILRELSGGDDPEK